MCPSKASLNSLALTRLWTLSSQWELASSQPSTSQEEVYGRRTRVMASREATSPIRNLENVVNLPMLVSSYCCHFLSSLIVASPTARSSESFVSFAQQDSSESCFVVVFRYSSRFTKSSFGYGGGASKLSSLDMKFPKPGILLSPLVLLFSGGNDFVHFVISIFNFYKAIALLELTSSSS